MKLRSSQARIALAGLALLALGWVVLRGGGAAPPPEVSSLDEPEQPARTVDSPAPVAAAGATDRVAPSEPPVDPPAAEPVLLALRVLDPEGVPVPGADVYVWPGGEEEARGRHVTDAGGKVQLSTTIDPASYFAEASAAGVGRSGAVRLRVQRKDADGVYELTLSQLGTIVGIVLGADGQPVGSAEVTATFPGQRFGAGTPRGGGPIETDAAGEFRFELLGECTFEFMAERFGASTEVVKARVTGGEESEVVLRFGGKCVVTGVVLAPDGAPDASATVHLWELTDRDAATETIQLEARADTAGAFLFELFHGGEFLLLATSEQHASSEPVALDLARGEDRGGLALRLTPAAEIAGRVVDATGAPLAGIVVGAQSDEFDPSYSIDPRGVRSKWYDGAPLATTDALGRFRLAPVRPGDALYVVICAPAVEQRDRWARERGVRAGTTDLEIVLTEERLRRGFVHGRVTQEGTGAPPERLILQLSYQRPDGSWSHESPRELEPELGKYLREGLEPGLEYTLAVLQHLGGMRVHAETFVASLDGTRVDVELPLARSVELRVLPDPVDGSVPNTLLVESPFPHPAGPDAHSIRLDREGVAHVPLAPGRYLARRGDAVLEFRVRPVDGLQIVRLE